ncbi:MAG TPA: inositol monophosphatase family protein [Novosphingobium sp.]|nr:inositol monophosphatase family protein [Novosphingobium sp.]
MREASERAILPRWRKLAAHEIDAKAAAGELADVVTIADREAEAILAEGLARLLPEAGIVGEEAAHADPAVLDRLSDALCWVIDPLDGTNNFAEGEPPFGVIVALAEQGETVAGWIYDCLSGRACHATRGGGAFIGDERIVARDSKADPPILANSLIYMSAAKRAAVQAHVAPHYTLLDIPRCAAEQYPRLALGVNDLALFERTLPWDHAAGVLFVNEAGGKAARPDGTAYRLDDHARKGLIGASSERLWDDLAARLNAL